MDFVMCVCVCVYLHAGAYTVVKYQPFTFTIETEATDVHLTQIGNTFDT